MSANKLAIFAKAPRVGAVKTRLEAHLGAAGAYAAHGRLVDHALKHMLQDEYGEPANFTAELWANAPTLQMRGWARAHELELFTQCAGGLGAKMHHALASMLNRGASRVIVAGTDCPNLGLSYINQAFVSLGAHDVVIAPAEDGGYGLIGCKAPCWAIFEGIAWGGTSVYAQTHKLCRQQQLSVVTLERIWDVDEPAEWRRFRERFD